MSQSPGLRRAVGGPFQSAHLGGGAEGFRACVQGHIEALAPLADAQRAVPMRAYMRDQFPYLGIPMPVRREAVKALVRAPTDHDTLLAAAQALWALPEREYQYSAVDLLARHWRLLGDDDIPVLMQLVLDRPWWDTVDSLAGVLGDVLLARTQAGRPEVPEMEAALLAPTFWWRRIAMLHQLGWKAQTDADRLWRYALHLAPEGEFFIRKAIGWALRDFARTEPDAVRRFLAQHQGQLSALTVREAGKHLG